MGLELSPLAESGVLFGGVLIAALAVLIAFYYRFRRRNTPEERERRRRLRVHREGRITDGLLHEIEDAEGDVRLVHYTYRIGAVDYSACQDVTELHETVGDDPKDVVGAVTVKVHQRNPYDSIVVCEDWSGLRRK